MSRILYCLALIALVTGCAAPEDTNTDQPVGASESTTPAATEKAPAAAVDNGVKTTAKVDDKNAVATTAVATAGAGAMSQ